MTKRGQTIEANFLHEPRVWRTSFLWPRRSDILCRSRILPKVCSHELGKLIFFNFCDFHFSLTIFRTRFWPRGHVPRGWSHNEKERSWNAEMFRYQNFENRTRIEGVMAMTIKTLQNSHCRQQTTSQVWLTREWGSVMMILIGSSGYFDCLNVYNSLNVSFPKPFIFICWPTMWHVLTLPETCLKVGPWKIKITKIK